METAVKFQGVFNPMFEKIGLQLQKGKRGEFDGVIEDLKSTLGEEQFSKLWTEGILIEIEEAVEIFFTVKKKLYKNVKVTLQTLQTL